jgi:uncharacterized membrane protein (UPF0127 family)
MLSTPVGSMVRGAARPHGRGSIDAARVIAALLFPVLLVPALLVSGLAARGDQPSTPPQHLPIDARWCPAVDPPVASLPQGPRRTTATAGPDAQTTIKPGCVALEVPRTWHQYTLGLQLRPPLPTGRGMWFAYRPAQVARFWMHRTPEPLDMVFVRNAQVIAIEPAAAPCMRLPCPSYGPDEPVDGVLELAAGQASQLGLRVGSPLRVELLRSFGPTAPAPD